MASLKTAIENGFASLADEVKLPVASAGTYGSSSNINNASANVVYQVPIIKVYNYRISSVSYKNFNTHCSHCAHCTHDNQCSANTAGAVRCHK